jgi:beta-galactosidase
MLYSLPSKWLMQSFPPLAGADGGPDPRAYHGLFDPFYRGAFDAGLQVRILHTGQLAGDTVRRHPVLIATGLYIAGDDTLARLSEYANAGGHLVLGPRTGYADDEARARTEVAPAHLTEAAGVRYDEYSNISTDIAVRAAATAPFDLPPEAAATRWIDGLQPAGAEVLAGYEHPHFGRWPAITSKVHGRGRITYVGTLPNRAMVAALYRWLVPVQGPDWRTRPESVTVTGATARDGRRIRFVHNWSWEPATVTLPAAVRDALTGADLDEGAELALGAWDVRVLVER